MACFCLMTEHDFEMMAWMKVASPNDPYGIRKAHFINQTAFGVLVQIKGGTKLETAHIARTFQSLFFDAQPTSRTPHSHHIIPQQFRKECQKKLGFVIDNCTVLIDAATHDRIHQDGYNKIWADKIDECKKENMNAEQAREVINTFAWQCIFDFGIGAPYTAIKKHGTHL